MDAEAIADFAFTTDPAATPADQDDAVAAFLLAYVRTQDTPDGSQDND